MKLRIVSCADIGLVLSLAGYINVSNMYESRSLYSFSMVCSVLQKSTVQATPDIYSTAKAMIESLVPR